MSWILYLYYTAIGAAILLVGLTALGSFGLDLDHDGHPDFDDDHEDAGGLLSLLGVGKAPMSILMMSYFLIFGLAGVIFCLAGSQLDGYELYSLIFAGSCSLVLTSLGASTLGRLIPTVETYSSTNKDLIGSSGVAFTTVSQNSGSANITDLRGSLHRIPAVTVSGTIDSGSKILVVNYNDENSTFVVEQLPD
jgi:hypothetical protein